MSERAHDLADRFDRANEDLIAFAQGLSRTQWRMLCPREGRTVGVVVYHVAEGHALTTEVTRAIALGEPLPEGLARSKEEVDLKNARQAEEHADRAQAETVELLQRNGAAAVRFVQDLTDEQLERVASLWGNQGTVAELIEHVMIRHLVGHFVTLRAWIEGEKTA